MGQQKMPVYESAAMGHLVDRVCKTRSKDGMLADIFGAKNVNRDLRWLGSHRIPLNAIRLGEHDIEPIACIFLGLAGSNCGRFGSKDRYDRILGYRNERHGLILGHKSWGGMRGRARG